MIKKFHYTSRFKQKLQSFSKEERHEIIEEMNAFADDPFALHLLTHPLRPPMTNKYSFSVLPDLLIIFGFLKPDKSEVIFYDIGTHDIYK